VNTKDWSSVPADGATLTSEATFCMENSVIVNVYFGGDDEIHYSKINRKSAFIPSFFIKTMFFLNKFEKRTSLGNPPDLQ